jgi:hypothetical protein
MSGAPASVASPSRSWAPGLFFLSAATLLFEINLTRLFSVAQFYHFAFMIISLAMLGYGASGTVLALFPGFGRRRPQVTLALLALGGGLGCVAAYALTNLLPFDSFSIAVDRRQVAILVLHYLALSGPFFCSGAATGLLFVLQPRAVGGLYATNLAGSAAGCLLTVVAPLWAGGEGTVLLCGLLGGVAALCFAFLGKGASRRVLTGAAVLLLGSCLAGLVYLPPPLELRLSPYKGLSYALQFPGASVTWRRWNSVSRIDLVHSPGIRSLPGLSFLYLELPPPQRGLFVDGDDLSPVLALSPTILGEPTLPAELAFSGYLPTAGAYQLRPGADVLVLEPRGGLEIWTALAQGAARVTAVESNPLIVGAAGEIYAYPRVTTVVEDPRSFVRRTAARYDVVTLALTTPYHPIRSGAYSLAEDYAYTVEAFQDYLGRLRPGGLLVVTRWLQVPPSEELRALALAVTAVEQAGGDPARQIVAFRGYAALTLLVKNGPFTAAELAALRGFTTGRAFDLVYAPDMRPEEANRYNVLPEPIYSQTFDEMLRAPDRAAWYAAYPLDVAPPTDDRPFFGHFFKWSQAGQVMAELGKVWQPFGGAGYFVLLVLLAVALGAAALIILLPLAVVRRGTTKAPGHEEGAGRLATKAPRHQEDAGSLTTKAPRHQEDAGSLTTKAPRHEESNDRIAGRRPTLLRTLAYFGLLGLGYLLVEVPLVQRFILFLGHPAYALTTVLFALLLFSGVGSALSARLPLRVVLVLLVLLILAYPLLLPPLFAAALGLPLVGRIVVAVVVLAPAGLLMGVPFPAGLRRLEAAVPRRIPWAWGVNGAASVVASVLAALLALSFGFNWVLFSGALCYAAAWLLPPAPVPGPGAHE